MAIDTDPRTDERREIDDLMHPTVHSSWLAVIVLLVGVALAGVYIYLRDAPSVISSDGSKPTITAP
jgi:hypothetical protein